MLSIEGDGRIAHCVVRTTAFANGYAGKKSVGPGYAAILGSSPANISRAARGNAPGLKSAHNCQTIGQFMGFDLRGMLAGGNGKGIGADLRLADICRDGLGTGPNRKKRTSREG